VNGEGLGRQYFHASVAFTPTDSYREFLGVHFVNASATKRFNSPFGGAICGRRTGDATAYGVREIAEIFFERRGAESALNHIGREF
jgi:hypothetical protein